MNLSHRWAACAIVIGMLATTPWAAAQAQPMQPQDQSGMYDQSGRMRDRDQMRERDEMRQPDQMRVSPQRHDKAAAFQYSPELKRASQLLGKEVVDIKGEKAGTVDDLVIDADAGMVGYVIVARGGILGMGERLVPVPFNSCRPRSNGLMMEANKELLDHARALRDDNISFLSDPSEAEGIHSQFNVQPYWASLRRMGPGEGMRSARRMQQNQQFESGREQGVYGYGQPGTEQDEVVPDRRDRSQYRDNTRANDYEERVTGAEAYSEEPYATQSRREQNARQRNARQDGASRTNRPRPERGSTEKIDPQDNTDLYVMDEGPSSDRWEREISGEPIEQGTVSGKPIERPHWRSTETVNHPGNLILAKDLMEEDVEGPRQQTVGELEDLMVDMNTGGIAYAIVSDTGRGRDTYHPVPWALFNTREGRHHDVLTLDMTTRDLQASPSFEKRDWPDMASTQWTRDVHNYFGVEPGWEYYGYVKPEAQEASVRFDPQAVTTLHGTVEGIDRRGRLGSESNIVRLRITTTRGQQPTGAAPSAGTQPAQARTETQPAQSGAEMLRPGEQITVYLAPGQYIRQQNFSIRGGETVTIEGSRVTLNGEPAILASKITGSDGKTLELRDQQGRPMWSQGQMEVEQGQMSEPQTGEQRRGMPQQQQPPAVQGQPGQ